MSIKERCEIPQEYKWAIEDIFATDQDWENALEEAKTFPKIVASYKGKLSTSAKDLLSFIQFGEKMSTLFDSLINYAQRKLDEDTRKSQYQDMVARLMSVMVEVNSNGSFETPEILSMEDATIEQYLKEVPELQLYKLYLDRVREQKSHILSEEEERLISLTGKMSNSADTIFSMFNDADLTFDDAIDSNGSKHTLTHGTYTSLMQSKDRVLRKSAFDSLYSAYGKFKNTTSAILSSQVEQLTFHSKVRKYNSNLEASLSGNHVPVEVYHNLIESVHKNMHYMYKYAKLRKKLLGVDELHMYDMYVPLVNDYEVSIPFDMAKQEVEASLSVMGKEYVDIFKSAFTQKWIDIYENVGKCSGAYSAGAKVHPYVLLNYNDTLDSEFTLAHEMGHAIHSYYSNRYQPEIYSNYVIFVAEVASTCNESLLMQYLLKHTDDKKRRAYLINYFLEQFRTTLYRQTMFAEFELKINTIVEQGQSLTADMLCEIYGELNKLYFGDDVVIDDNIKLEWSRIPHFYYDFYVYQYATGFSSAIALSRKILNEGEPAVKDYINFLKGGCSKNPVDLLKGAGVDIVSGDVVGDALKLFGELIDELDSLLS